MPISPFQAAAITRYKAAPDFPMFPLDVLDRHIAFAPFKYAVSAGVLSAVALSRQDGAALQVAHSAAGVQFVNAPMSKAANYQFVGRSQATACVVTQAASGSPVTGRQFTLTTGGTPTINLKGFLALGDKDAPTPKFTNGSLPSPSDMKLGRYLAERVRKPAYSFLSGLAVFALRFKVDASGIPVANTAFGWPHFFVSKSSTGVYSLTLGVSLPPSTVAIATCDSRGADVVTIAANVVTINTFNVAAAADPTTNSEIQILFFVPTTKASRDQMLINNTTAPRKLDQRSRNFPMMTYVREGVLIPVVLSINSSGDIIAAGTVLPDGVEAYRNGTSYVIQCGAGFAQYACAAFQADSGIVAYPVDYTSFAAQGRIAFTATIAVALKVHGWILASATKVQ